MTGKGQRNYDDTQIIGQFNNVYLIGNGTLYYSKNNSQIYKGEFSNCKIEGNEKLYKSGNVLIGKFKNGKIIGEGMLYDKN